MQGQNRQLALTFPPQENKHRNSFILSGCNRRAFQATDLWPEWPARFLALSGPAKSGKTHLATIWQQKSGATWIDSETLIPESRKPVWILDFPGPVALNEEGQEKLFHLYNRIHNEQGWMLLSADEPPGHWDVGLKDLKSRLRGIPLSTIGPPDDELLQNILKKLFADRQLDPAENLFPYLLTRAERSFSAMSKLAVALDQVALEKKRPVTIALAREILPPIS